MADREKVVGHLYDCLAASRLENTWVFVRKNIVGDAMALLKEQEPQLVINIGEQISCKSGSCPKCGKMLNTTCNKRYCGDCGQEVTWE